MNVVFRISRDLLRIVQRDLARPHLFASERVGFLACRPGALGHDEVLILAESFHSIADDDYVESKLVGAMMGSAAIRKALQIAYSDRMSMFHIHMHEHFGRPSFSSVDLRESAVFVPDFWHVCPSHPHGALVLSKDSAAGLCWYPGARHPLPIGEIVIVGAPMEVISNART
jgi:hypothetical protein